jgi:ubiquinone/menaquinone biosynthesis C-methylase UbiE
MSLTSDPVRLFSSRADSYLRFVRSVGYPQAIRAFFEGSPLLREGLRVLDAGCGSGIVTLALREAMLSRGLPPALLHGFDLTPAMLERFRAALGRRGIRDVELAQADVLERTQLPASWHDYDLVVSASMLEYLPRARFTEGLAGLRSLLRGGGSFVLFITRRNRLTRPLIGRWWHANLYDESDLRRCLRDAGFASLTFRSFPMRFRYLGLWGYILEARR